MIDKIYLMVMANGTVLKNVQAASFYQVAKANLIIVKDYNGNLVTWKDRLSLPNVIVSMNEAKRLVNKHLVYINKMKLQYQDSEVSNA
jgi:hypothetical protein